MTKNKIIPYKPKLKTLARELRKSATKSERKLWRALRGKSLGVEFHRQVPIDNFIVDFYCHELMLVIELDGITHDSECALAKDSRRQRKLEALGIEVMRFYDNDVYNNLEGVVWKINNWVDSRRNTSP